MSEVRASTDAVHSRREYAGEQAAWQVLSSTGAQSYGATLSSSVAWTGVIAAFEAG